MEKAGKFHCFCFPGGSDGKESACNTGDPSLIHGSGRSPEEGNGNSFNYSCLENPMDRGVQRATVQGIAKSQTRLSDLTLSHTFSFCFTDYTKAFDCVDHNKLWKILKEMGIPDHLTYFLRNLYAGQDVTVRTQHVTTDWFKLRKGVWQDYILSPCLFNFYSEYIMRNAGLHQSQAWIETIERNINNFKYADNTTLTA